MDCKLVPDALLDTSECAVHDGRDDLRHGGFGVVYKKFKFLFGALLLLNLRQFLLSDMLALDETVKQFLAEQKLLHHLDA